MKANSDATHHEKPSIVNVTGDPATVDFSFEEQTFQY